MKKSRVIRLVVLTICLLAGGVAAGVLFFVNSQEQVNPDIYGRIYIPDTEIDYPILQHPEDNSYYLTHDAKGEENPSGAIFSEAYNSRNFEDPITILYGNHMEDGSMFGGLQKYGDNLYMKEHPYIYIYSGDMEYKYRIFAAYLSDNRHLMERFCSGKSQGNRKAYLKSIFNNRTMEAQIDESVEVSADSGILTLSTHDSRGEQYRYLVQAYLTEKKRVSPVETEK